MYQCDLFYSIQLFYRMLPLERRRERSEPTNIFENDGSSRSGIARAALRLVVLDHSAIEVRGVTDVERIVGALDNVDEVHIVNDIIYEK